MWHINLRVLNSNIDFLKVKLFINSFCYFSTGTSQQDTICKKCADGYFSPSSSALDMCVKHQECADGQLPLMPGSVYHDTLCGSCDDLANDGKYECSAAFMLPKVLYITSVFTLNKQGGDIIQMSLLNLVKVQIGWTSNIRSVALHFISGANKLTWKLPLRLGNVKLHSHLACVAGSRTCYTQFHESAFSWWCSHTAQAGSGRKAVPLLFYFLLALVCHLQMAEARCKMLGRCKSLPIFAFSFTALGFMKNPVLDINCSY